MKGVAWLVATCLAIVVVAVLATLAMSGAWAQWSKSRDTTGLVTAASIVDLDVDGIPDALDNCPAWPNADQSLPPWPVPADDRDCDGFTTADESSIGTDPNLACGPNAWPPDHNDDGLISISDVLLMKASFGAKSPDDPIYDARRDLNPDGKISISDVLMMKAFFDQECTFV